MTIEALSSFAICMAIHIEKLMYQLSILALSHNTPLA